ncbi:MAG TPA: hypothetical protein VF855_08600 [Acidimicrobiales bacterium]
MAALLLLVLTGCRLDIAVNVTMDEQGAGTVQVRATADKELLDKEPSALGDLRVQDLRAAGWSVDGPVIQSDGSALLVATKGFADPSEGTAVLAELSSPEGPWRELKLQQGVRFGTVDSSLSGHMVAVGPDAFSDQNLVDLVDGLPLPEMGDPIADGTLVLSLTAQLPGTARTQTGEGIVGDDQSTVTWTVKPGTDTAFSAQFERRDEGAFAARRTERLARLGIVAYLAFVALMAVALLWWWRRVKPSADPREGARRPTTG